MAAATVTLSSANKKTAYRLFERVRRGLNIPNSNPDGLLLPLDSGSFTPASTSTDDAGDVIRALQVPFGFKLVSLQIVSTAEVDTGGNALVFDVTAETEAAVHTTLISGCTVGQGATDKDDLDANSGHLLRDIGASYISLKITTPATGNAGTGALRVKALGYMGDLVTP